MCSFFAIHRQKYARNSGAKVDDPLKDESRLLKNSCSILKMNIELPIFKTSNTNSFELSSLDNQEKVLFKLKKSFFNFISSIRSKNTFRANINLFDFKNHLFTLF